MDRPTTAPAATGEALRDQALSILRARRAELIAECERAALRSALAAGSVTADIVRGAVTIPDGLSPKLVGVAFRDLADAGILRRDGYAPSTRPVAHARPLSVWRLADRDAGIARLDALTRSTT